MRRPNTRYDAWASIRNRLEERLFQIELAFKGDPSEMDKQLDLIKDDLDDLEAHLPDMKNMAREWTADQMDAAA